MAAAEPSASFVGEISMSASIVPCPSAGSVASGILVMFPTGLIWEPMYSPPDLVPLILTEYGFGFAQTSGTDLPTELAALYVLRTQEPVLHGDDRDLEVTTRVLMLFIMMCVLFWCVPWGKEGEDKTKIVKVQVRTNTALGSPGVAWGGSNIIKNQKQNSVWSCARVLKAKHDRAR